MISISHRGYWLTSAEKNSVEAFRRSFSQGYGTETDIRDFNGELVISHDIPNKDCLLFEDFLKLFISYDHTLTLALNIKSDGLAKKINEYLLFYNVNNYFCFDMSIPDTLAYLKENMNVYMRRSEYESESELFQCAKGVWLDSFKHDNFQCENIINYMEKGKSVCIVSPELHRRNEKILWNGIKSLSVDVFNSTKLMLCTDKLDKASEYFYE